MSDTILLHCHRCGREVTAARSFYDPPAAVKAVTPCPECAVELGAFDPDTTYYDAEGNEISGDPEVWALPDDFHLDAIYMTRRQKERERECD